MIPSSPLFSPDHASDPEKGRALAEAMRICRVLREAGHVAYFAGGCVRDALLQREPKDYDVATDATPDRVREVFGRKRTLAFGASFGVIGVQPLREGDRQQASSVAPTEVATFRSDGEYSDGRRPDKVHFGNAEQDALRRDFTINGLFYDPERDEVIDFVDGRRDLVARQLRTIGDARDRFDEDKLRMLRAVRFATTLEFELDPATLREIQVRCDEIAVVSAERIGAEMRRLMSAKAAAMGLRLLVESKLDRQILPELKQADFDVIDRYLAHRVDDQFVTSMSMLLLALGDTRGGQAMSEVLASVGDRWRLSNEEIRQISAAIRDFDVILRADHLKWSEVQPRLIDRDVLSTLVVAESVMRANGLEPGGYALCTERLALPAERLDPEPLVSGDRLREIGYRPGPEFRGWLQAARVAQLDGEIDSESEALKLIADLAKA